MVAKAQNAAHFVCLNGILKPCFLENFERKEAMTWKPEGMFCLVS